jgi:hypothetical protein
MRLAVLVATSTSEPGQRATSRTVQGQLNAMSKRVQEKNIPVSPSGFPDGSRCALNRVVVGSFLSIFASTRLLGEVKDNGGGVVYVVTDGGHEL